MALNLTTFSRDLKSLGDFSKEKNIAIALSGGGDSLALAYLMMRWAARKKITLHLLTVDHGLRASSAQEAKEVRKIVKDWPVIHKILNWKGEKSKTRIQEAARNARYDLMADYCRKHKISYLFLAHHADDQMETFLFRLAKGSGLDGLTVMKPQQIYNDGLTLVRPCLNYSHSDLLDICRKAKLNWTEDPSNDTDRFARVRLRKSAHVLEREGLNPERISTLARRLERARSALTQVTDQAEKNCILKIDTQRIEVSLPKWLEQPEEIGLRILQRSTTHLSASRPYPVKLQKLEEIVSSIIHDKSFKAASLGGCVIRVKRRLGILEIQSERSG